MYNLFFWLVVLFLIFVLIHQTTRMEESYANYSEAGSMCRKVGTDKDLCRKYPGCKWCEPVYKEDWPVKETGPYCAGPDDDCNE